MDTTKFDAWHSFLTNQIKMQNTDNVISDINKELLKELDWCSNAPDSQEEIYERFYKDIEFGTGGLRGILGAGTNRMNLYTVAKATQGIADYISRGEYIADSPLKNKRAQAKPSVAIAYDSRIYSDVFARIAAETLAANDIDVYLYEELMPTPALSFAVRQYGCAMGIMVTASHNPAEYNGYKVYDNSGCQVTLSAAGKIFSYIEKVDIFTGVKRHGGSGTVTMLGQDAMNAFLDAVMEESVLAGGSECGFGKEALKKLSVVYTPLNGAGNKPVRALLKRMGIENVHVVKEQELPDGNFPTCPYPNPEKKEALDLGLKLCRDLAEQAGGGPDLLLATDPDCDRAGIAVRVNNGQGFEYKLLSGNETGILLLDFLIALKAGKNGVKNPCVITTIVSTKMAGTIAKKHGIRLIYTLTGFKFIGEQIGFLENEGREKEYLFGFEESYGYLSGAYVRDKDAVNAAMLICEMAAYYKEKGMQLSDRLTELYEEYGFYKNELLDFTFKGAKGMQLMEGIMQGFRSSLPEKFIGRYVEEVADYQAQERRCLVPCSCAMGESISKIPLPKADVIEVVLDGGCSFAVRPSGTEPKLKIYISARGETEKQALDAIDGLKFELSNIVNRR